MNLYLNHQFFRQCRAKIAHFYCQVIDFTTESYMYVIRQPVLEFYR